MRTLRVLPVGLLVGVLGLALAGFSVNASAKTETTRLKKSAKAPSATSHMIVLNGATYFRVPVAQFPNLSSDFKKRSNLKIWMIRKETIETAGQFKEGGNVAEIRSISPAKLKAPSQAGMDDCGITETWLAASSREAQDDSLNAKVKNAKSTSYWNTKGFEIPEGFELVDTKTESKLTDSMLLELVNKSNGEMWMAAEFKKGDARYFVVPESTDDEFRSFFSVYLKPSPKSGLALLKRFDFVETCP